MILEDVAIPTPKPAKPPVRQQPAPRDPLITRARQPVGQDLLVVVAVPVGAVVVVVRVVVILAITPLLARACRRRWPGSRTRRCRSERRCSAS